MSSDQTHSEALYPAVHEATLGRGVGIARKGFGSQVTMTEIVWVLTGFPLRPTRRVYHTDGYSTFGG